MSNKILLIICLGIVFTFILASLVVDRHRDVKGASVFSPKITKIPGNAYSLSEVANHNDANSCWAVIGNRVYDLTSWISIHPGGDVDILSLCGKNGTDVFNSQHFGQAEPMDYLNSFEIGTLSR